MNNALLKYAVHFFVNSELDNRLPGDFQICDILYAENNNELIISFKNHKTDDYHYDYVVGNTKYRLDKVTKDGTRTNIFIKTF